MRFIFTLSLLFCASLAAVSQTDMRAEFHKFLVKYNKNYSTEEAPARFANFAANFKRAERMNKVDKSAKYGVTKFMDMSQEEFRQKMLMGKVAPEGNAVNCLATGVDATRYYHASSAAPAASFDWRDYGKVTPVKDQGQCGSCWTFSVVGAIESGYAVANKIPNATVVLSEQAIVDCSQGCAMEDGQSVCNQGCNGGWPWSATADVISWGGLPTEAAYPYQGEDGTCSIAGKKLLYKPKNYTCLSGPNQSGGPADETTAMPNALQKFGPLSIALDATLFQIYTSGIINPYFPSVECSDTSLDHAVLLIGWGVESGTFGSTPYWTIKNSWGADWGENGFVRMYRGEGLCGLNAAVMAMIF